MAWTPKFSGLPSSTDIPLPGDSYSVFTGAFSLGAFSFQTRTLQWAGGFPTSPIAYETLASMGADITQILRVTGRLSVISGGTGSTGGGIVLYGPDRSDQCWTIGNDGGFWYAQVTENGTDISVASVTDAGAVPWQFRIYWNGTASPFVIPDAGFGSWSVAATTQSVWYSKDDGSNWVRLGDRTIAAGVAPTRIGIAAWDQEIFGGAKTITFSNLDVQQEGGGGGTAYEFTCNETVTAVDTVGETELEYCDYFDDGVPLPTLAGNGSVSEAAGQLIVNINAGVNSDWWTFGRNGILAYEQIPYIAESSLVYFETELASLTIPDSTYSHAMWGLYVDAGNFIYFGFNGTSLWAGGTTGYAGWWSGGSTAITYPARVRIGWQPSNGRVYFDWHNGTDWQRVYTLTTYTLQYQRIFYYNKNWSYLPAITSNWSYLCIWPLEPVSIDLDHAGVLDVVEFPSSSVETAVWPAPDVPEGLLKADHFSNTLDGMEFPSSAVEEAFWQAPEIPLGLPRTSFEGRTPDSFFLTLGRAQYKADSQSSDSEGHPHFVTYRPYLLVAGDTTNEAWDNPTTTNFTGYARNGTRYTNGVQDPGPVYAPWYSEGASNDRSSVGAFPQKYLISVTRLELVIFDFSNYPTNLDVWMRFRIGTSTSDTYKLLGRSPETIAEAKMVNGVLVVTTLENGTDRGRLFLIDFRQDDQRFGNLIGSDDHWIGAIGRDITDRDLASNWTTTGATPEMRIGPEYVYSMSAYSLADGSKYWVAVSGEDQGPEILEVDSSGIPQLHLTAQGDLGGDNLGDVRRVLFDRDGWFWHSYYSRLYRAGVYYQYEGLVEIPSSNTDPRYPFVDLGSPIRDLVDSENYIYAATDLGVYRIHRGTLETRLIWTIAGGGGVGLSGIPGDGELLVGTKPEVVKIRAYSLNGSGYIAVASKLDGGDLHGGVTLIKTKDDTVLDSKLYPDLAEDGAYVSIPVGLNA